MIVGTIQDQQDAEFAVKMSKVLYFLQNTDLSSLPVGQIVLEPEAIIAYVQEYTTQPASEIPFEAHEKFIDMQVVVSGQEIIAYAPQSRLKAKGKYNSTTDTIYFEEPEEFGTLPLYAGDFVVMNPTEGHKPRCMMAQACPVKKIVVKIHV